MKRFKSWLSGLLLLGFVATPAHAQTLMTYTVPSGGIPAGSVLTLTESGGGGGSGGSISYVGRTDGYANASPGTAEVQLSNITTNGGVENGDFLVFASVAYSGSPGCPSGTTEVGAANDDTAGSLDYTDLCTYQWSTGGPTTFTVSGPWPKLIVRDYRPSSGASSISVDQNEMYPAANGSNTSASSMTLPALSNTADANEVLVNFNFIAIEPTTVSNASLSNTESDSNQWGSLDGDYTLGSAGSTVPAMTASSSAGAGRWVGSGLTLIP